MDEDSENPQNSVFTQEALVNEIAMESFSLWPPLLPSTWCF